MQIVPPNRTIAHRGAIEVGGRTIELHHLGRGHTDNDLVIVISDAGVVFAGDLVEEGGPLSFGDSYPLEWPATNERLLELITGPVVPGHGDVVDSAFVHAQTKELAAAAEAAIRAHRSGQPTEAILTSLPFPEPNARECLGRVYAQLEGTL